MKRAVPILSVCMMMVVILSGCLASRNVEYNGNGNSTTVAQTIKPIPQRSASREKVPVGVMVGIDNEVIALYPTLQQNNVGLGIDYIVREQLSNSDWFTLCAVDPQLISAFEKLKDYYWQGNIPDDKFVESKKPEYILMIGVTRVDIIGKEKIVAGSKRFNGQCSVKINIEKIPLLSGQPNIDLVVSGEGAVTVREVDSLFTSGAQLRASKFGEATENAINNAVADMINKL